MIKNIILLSAISTLMLSCGNDKAVSNADNKGTKTEAVKFDMKAEVDELKKITKAFGGALKAELGAAMKAGGPINALAVCNEKALPITKEISKQKNVQISRVSLKNRNSNNVPNEWQTKILQDFDKRAAGGEDIAKMGHAEVIENNGKKQLYFMKALPTGKVCLKCHGSELSKEVTAKLAELYPNDKATGYAENQVRGAIVIVKDIQQKKTKN
jgi:hypothetical protein